MEKQRENPIKRGFKRPSRDTYIITLLAGVYLLNPLILGFLSYLIPGNKELIQFVTNYMNSGFPVVISIGAAYLGTNKSIQSISNSKKKEKA